MQKIIFIISILFISSAQALQSDWKHEEKLSYVYLTWAKDDTSNHITVNYHSQLTYDMSQVLYSETSKNGEVNQYEKKAFGGARRIDYLKRSIHSITIEELKPNTVYYFVVGDFVTGFSKEYKFKTLPADNSPIRFITGGDMGAREKVEDMMILAAERDPDFVAIGGDIAYANGKIKNYAKWDEWLSMYTETMITTDSRLIPMNLALGNHEVNTFAINENTRAPFFYGLFDQGIQDRSFFKRRLGSHTILYYLDSGHINFFAGSQTRWLKKEMEKNQDIQNQFAIYHIPLYPSHRKYKGIANRLGRKSWLSIFDKYKLDLAFENHDHTFKVTHPLKGGEINEDGTIYLGDGCWGRKPRKAQANRWYLEKTSGTVHVWEITTSDEGFQYEAIADGGSSLYFNKYENY